MPYTYIYGRNLKKTIPVTLKCLHIKVQTEYLGFNGILILIHDSRYFVIVFCSTEVQVIVAPKYQPENKFIF